MTLEFLSLKSQFSLPLNIGWPCSFWPIKCGGSDAMSVPSLGLRRPECFHLLALLLFAMRVCPDYPAGKCDMRNRAELPVVAAEVTPDQLSCS